MKKILNKIGKVLQAVLMAPVKLPGRTPKVLRYIALALGIVETVLKEEEPEPPDQVPGTENGQLEERGKPDEME